jgi:iron complex outermembrane receptor protein
MHRPFFVPLLRLAAGAALLILMPIAPVQAQPAARAIDGTVARRDGQPVAGATVSVEGSSTSAVTTPLGRFHIDAVPAASVALVVQAEGFVTTRVPDVTAGDSTKPVAIVLDATPSFLERVQVTGTKVPTPIQDIAAQASVIDRATVEDRGDQTLVQAIAHVPGAVVSTQLGIFDSVMLRGMPRGDPEFTNTLLLVDGVPQTTSRNGARVVGLTINDASSIEVVRGPNAALYGRTAIGGAINVRTEDPTPQREWNVDLTGGEMGTAKAVVRASGPISSWGGYVASIGKERTGGYYHTKTGGDFVDGNTALFGKLTMTPDARSSAMLSVNRVSSDNSTPTNEPIVDGQLLHTVVPAFDRLTNFNVPGPNYHQGETRLTATYSRQLSAPVRVVNVFGYRDVQQRFINDGDFIGSPIDLDAHTVEQYPFNQDLKEKIAYEEARLELTPHIGRVKSTIVVGGSYEHTSGTLASDFLFTDADNEGIPIDFLNPVIPPASTWSHDVQPTRTYHLGNSALFAQVMAEPGSRWVFSAGGRYDREALDNQAEGSDKVSDTFSAFSPKASVTYKLLTGGNASAASLSLYGAYSHAFLPPRAPSSLTPANVDLDLKAEDIDNVEGGVKGTLAQARLSFEATVFHMIEDGVVLSRHQGPFFFPTNAGQQRYNGVETGVGITPWPKLSAYVNAAFYRNKFGDFVIESEDGDEALTGNRLPISPDYVVNWGASWTLPRGFDATLNVKHMGGVAADRENTFEIDPYSLVDAAVSWRRAGVRITLAARNLFDTAYYWNADGESADPGRPRQVLVTTTIGLK